MLTFLIIVQLGIAVFEALLILSLKVKALYIFHVLNREIVQLDRQLIICWSITEAFISIFPQEANKNNQDTAYLETSPVVILILRESDKKHIKLGNLYSVLPLFIPIHKPLPSRC